MSEWDFGRDIQPGGAAEDSRLGDEGGHAHYSMALRTIEGVDFVDLGNQPSPAQARRRAAAVGDSVGDGCALPVSDSSAGALFASILARAFSREPGDPDAAVNFLQFLSLYLSSKS
jgi:hypothetical protein